MIQKNDNGSEKGMMVVETTISFTIFVMVVFCIICLIDIFTIHNKIQFAINGAAHEIACYSYLYSASPLQDAENKLNADGSPYTQPIDTTVSNVVESYNKITSLYQQMNGGNVDIGSIEETGNSVSQSISSTVDLLSNPKETLIGGIYISADYVGSSVKKSIASAAVETLTRKYLSSPEISAEQLLKNYGILSKLDFSDSSMMCDDKRRLIDIIVSYDIDMKIVQLLIPSAKVHVVQRVTIPAWLDGDHKTLKDY